MARILVVGLGYLGAALAVRLANDGHDVFGIRREPSDIAGVQVLAADIADGSGLDAVPERVESVFFTAAPDASTPEAYRTIYVEGLRRVLARISSGPRVFFTSSTSVFGQDDGSLVDERSETRPSSFRGELMLDAEAEATTVLRLAGLYGPGRSRALGRLRAGNAEADPSRYMNFIHRDDAVSALIHLMSLDAPERLYLGVDHEPVQGELFYRWLAREAGTSEPTWLARGGEGKRLSSEKLRRSGFQFRYPSFREGYRALLQERVLEPCPETPNCVSTTSRDLDKRMPALGFRMPAADALASAVSVLGELGGEIAEASPDWVEARFTSSWFRFVDDVVLVVDEARRRLDFRSASRVGYSDLGANRRRMERFSRILTEQRGFVLLEPDELDGARADPHTSGRR